MRKERKIVNTNIRFNLSKEADRKAWEYLQTMDRKQYKSYTKAVVVALNDYFARQEKQKEDSYLETREKEDAFLKQIEEVIENEIRESATLFLVNDILKILQSIIQIKNLYRKETIEEREIQCGQK